MSTELPRCGVGASAASTLEWLDTSGSERDLATAILCHRLDEVVVVSSSHDRIERCLKLGFPAQATEPRLRLRPPPTQDAGETLVAPGQHGQIEALLRGGHSVEGTLWTVRLRPALTQSVLPAFEREFSVTDQQVLAYGQQSGDLNPLHFDDDFARSHGFERRITHGMIFNGWLTRLLGMEHPGAGTIFLRNTACYFAPVYANRAYKVRVSTPRHDVAKGTYLVVAQLFDADGRHCTVSYNDVMLRLPKARVAR